LCKGGINIKNNTFILDKQSDDSTELDYLEQIYKKVKMQELVQFNGKAFRRIYPKNNKYIKHPYHFYMIADDIYSGTFTSNNKWGEQVNTTCHYKAIIKK
jgi:hypothetical protein